MLSIRRHAKVIVTYWLYLCSLDQVCVLEDTSVRDVWCLLWTKITVNLPEEANHVGWLLFIVGERWRLQAYDIFDSCQKILAPHEMPWNNLHGQSWWWLSILRCSLRLRGSNREIVWRVSFRNTYQWPRSIIHASWTRLNAMSAGHDDDKRDDTHGQHTRSGSRSYILCWGY